MAILAGSGSLEDFQRQDQLVELLVTILTAKDSPLHSARLKRTCLARAVVIADRVRELVRCGWRTLLFQRWGFETVVGAREGVPAVRADRARQRLANLLHVRVAERDGARGEAGSGVAAATHDTFVEG